MNAFVEAVLGNDPDRLETSRTELYNALGEAGFVDAAGAVASFNAVVKVADGAGIELDEFKVDKTAGMRSQLGIDDFNADH